MSSSLINGGAAKVGYLLNLIRRERRRSNVRARRFERLPVIRERIGKIIVNLVIVRVRNAKFANSFKHRRLGIREIVEDDKLPPPGLGKRDASVRTDVAKTAGDEESHLKIGTDPFFCRAK